MIRAISLNESFIRECPTASTAVAVLVERRYMQQAQPAGLIRTLQARGRDVEVVIADGCSFADGGNHVLENVDVVIARGRSSQLLSALSWAEARGVTTINRLSSIAAVHNKAEMAAQLTSAGVPTPKTFVGSPRQLASRLEPELYPILLKPVYGDNGDGIQLIMAPEQLEHAHGPVVLAQPLVANDGFDLKLYCIGELTYAVRKRCSVPCLQTVIPAEGRHATGVDLIAVTDDMRQIARVCGRLFGLELFGVDLLETDRGLVVIEVNDYPNYTAVPAASELIADYVFTRMRQEKNS